MITITKPEKVPTKLIEVQNLIERDLFKKKDKFEWRGEHYNEAIKKDLKALYNNKCAYCEVKLTETNTEDGFTIEHFRPKNDYYWLGAEWTNLFPACSKCNNIKGNDFPLLDKRNKIKRENVPFDNSGKLIPEKCKVSNSDLLNEKPLYIHPEVDKPSELFRFNEFGKAIIQENLSKFQTFQAQTTLKLINRNSVEEKRKRKIIEFQDKLNNHLKKTIFELGKDYTDRELKLAFQGFFIDLYFLQKKEAEFSLLGYYMVIDFDIFFLKEIEIKFGSEWKKIIKYVYYLYIDKD